LKNCISPPELTDSQLLRFLDGEADKTTKLHLDVCEYCLDKAGDLAHLQNQLYGLAHPSPLELGEYHLRILPKSKAVTIEQHLRGCAQCRQEVEELEVFLGDLAPSAEDSLAKKAKVLIAKLVGGQAGIGRSGELGFAPAMVALRGEDKGPLAFEAEGIVITLDVQSGSKGQVSIQGQVAADEQDQWTGAVVQMLRDDLPESTAVLDDLGAFGFEEVQPGSIQLKITSTNDIEVQIPDIDITL
jgi:hypothetical protein